MCNEILHLNPAAAVRERARSGAFYWIFARIFRERRGEAGGNDDQGLSRLIIGCPASIGMPQMVYRLLLNPLIDFPWLVVT